MRNDMHAELECQAGSAGERESMSRSRTTFIDELVAHERTRLEKEFGLPKDPLPHYVRPKELPFTREQREHTTILFGGLTWKHDGLVQSVLEGLGYKCRPLPTPTVRSFQSGKEFGNNGQCNPTYFTVGNLINELQRLEAEGLTRREIIDTHVFFTAGACGPCRFGMYEAEYRLALRNAGFDGFRILLFQQSGGLEQANIDAGLDMNLDFFVGILNALNIGDILNDIAHQIRPYEIAEGETDRALEECVAIMQAALRSSVRRGSPSMEKLNGWPRLQGIIRWSGKFIYQFRGKAIVSALRQCRDIFASICVDRLRVRPIVKITGEFWAQTTEGDGNFNMFHFLEREGAQLLLEPIATWIMYLLHQAKQEKRDTRNLTIYTKEGWWPRFTSWIRCEISFRRKMLLFTLAEKVFESEYNRLRTIFHDMPYQLTDQYVLQRIAHPYYNSRAEGGEGHLEIAKNIYYMYSNLSHMVLSLKPFGCMPSTQSDGVQSAVASHFKNILYLPIETSGEGEINAHSRVQMVLGEARAKARAEMDEVLERHNVTIEQLNQFIEKHPMFRDPFRMIPRNENLTGVAANFADHVAAKMNS